MTKMFQFIFSLIFMNPKIIDRRFRKFSEDALKRLAIQNTANQFDIMLNDTEAKHTAYFGFIDDKFTLTAIKEARTMSVNNVIADFIAKMHRNEEIIAGLLQASSPAYHEVFPHGITEYNDVTKENIVSMITRVIVFAGTYETQLGGPTIKNQISAILTQYNSARGEQLTKMGELTNADANVDSSRLKLAKQWQDNLLDIAKIIKGEVELVRLFFSFHLLYPHSHVNDAGETVFEENTFGVPKNSQLDTGLVFTPATKFQFYNDGTVPIIVMLTVNNETQTVPADALVINPDEIVELLASQIGSDTCTHLRLINQSLTEDGQLTIEILS
jgi:hypothetical protein